MAVEPLSGFRYMEVRPQRTRVDYSEFMAKLASLYPSAKEIRLVQDNLNTHTPASFYQNMPPEEAFRLAQRFEMHYTPKKGSWLNMAEIELAALSKQCLDRRIDSIEKLSSETQAWTIQRNRKRVKIHWQFTQTQARTKFEKHYPTYKN